MTPKQIDDRRTRTEAARPLEKVTQYGRCEMMITLIRKLVGKMERCGWI